MDTCSIVGGVVQVIFGAAGLHRTGATHAMSVPALSCADLDKIKTSAAAFRRQQPQVGPEKLLWGERLLNREARDVYTMAQLGSQAIEAIRMLGARPCIICADFTTSWCEGCPMPSPFAVCGECDRANLLCHTCTADGKLWSLERAQLPPEVMEMKDTCQSITSITKP